MAFLMVANPASAQQELAMGPSFDCSKAKTAVEKTVCGDGLLLQGMDVTMARVFAQAKAVKISRIVKSQKKWLAQRDHCGTNAQCIHDRYAERLTVISKSLGDDAGLSGAYSYQLSSDTNFGQLWMAIEADGTASGGLQTISGPTFHFCTVEFRGARPIGNTLMWQAPRQGGTNDELECTVLFQPQSGGIQVDYLGCRQYCGARGWFNAMYKR